jgi:hypothetical protein
MNRRTFLYNAAVSAASLATFSQCGESARAQNSGVKWPIGCFNRPWAKWGIEAALDGIKRGLTLAQVKAAKPTPKSKATTKAAKPATQAKDAPKTKKAVARAPKVAGGANGEASEPTAEKPVACGDCGTEFPTSREAGDHMRDAHNSPEAAGLGG